MAISFAEIRASSRVSCPPLVQRRLPPSDVQQLIVKQVQRHSSIMTTRAEKSGPQ